MDTTSSQQGQSGRRCPGLSADSQRLGQDAVIRSRGKWHGRQVAGRFVTHQPRSPQFQKQAADGLCGPNFWLSPGYGASLPFWDFSRSLKGREARGCWWSQGLWVPGHPQLGTLWESVSLQPSSKGELHSENIGVVTDETELDTQRISQSYFFK